MNAEFLNNGIRLRWLNTAGFEIEMSHGKHILLDPFLNADIKGIPCWPISVDQIHHCDYLCLSHIHFDHAQDVRAIQDILVLPLCVMFTLPMAFISLHSRSPAD